MFVSNKKIKYFFPLLALLCLGPSSGLSASTPVEKMTVNLYFPHRDRAGLGVEQLEIETKGDLTLKLSRLLEVFFKGPETDLLPAFPPNLSLRQVFADSSGIAFVDLIKKNGALEPGVLEEWLGLAALVNTLCLNFHEIHMVKILVNGDEALTLFGHVDLTRPLLPDKAIITK